MFEPWSKSFRSLLEAFDAGGCPLCTVAGQVERSHLAKTRGIKAAPGPLCGKHLACALPVVRDVKDKVRLTRASIAAISTALRTEQPLPCEICSAVERQNRRLIRAIRRLDNRIRFQKALEAAPPFCLRHTRQVCADGRASAFRRVQTGHLTRFRDQLAQEELRGHDPTQTIEESLRAIGMPPTCLDGREDIRDLESETESGCGEERELSAWESERQLDHLGKLESEVAALRYRNAILQNENRAFRLARAAVEAMREDLERERRALAVTNHDSQKRRPEEE
jgi:hypothetical protein